MKIALLTAALCAVLAGCQSTSPASSNGDDDGSPHTILAGKQGKLDWGTAGKIGIPLIQGAILTWDLRIFGERRNLPSQQEPDENDS